MSDVPQLTALDKLNDMYYIYCRGDFMATLSVRLSEETYKRLGKLSEKTRRTKTSFIKEMIEESLSDYEDAYTALDRLNEKNAKYLTTEEMEKELGL
jgi:RHH-type transcriptional regulator, rel operon repressor / antitoxin RelB